MPAAPSRVRAALLLFFATAATLGLAMAVPGSSVLVVLAVRASHLPLGVIGTAIAAMSAGMIVSLVSGGALVDRFGPRSLAATASTALTSALLWWAVAPPAALLGLAIRVALLGLCAGPLGMAIARAVFSAFPPRQRGLAMGIRQTGVPLGVALAAAAWPPLVPRIGTAGALEWTAAVVWIAGMALALLAGRSPRSKAGQAGAVRAAAPWSRLAAPLGVHLLLAAGQFNLVAYGMVYLHSVDRIPLALAGRLLALAQGGGAVMRIAGGWWSDRRGGARAPLLGVLSASGMVLFAVLAAAQRLPVLTAALAFFALGMATTGWNGVALTWAGETAGAAAGLGMGMAATAVYLGGTVFPPAFGAVVAAHGYRAGWAGLAVVYGLATVIALRAASTGPVAQPRRLAGSGCRHNTQATASSTSGGGRK